MLCCILMFIAVLVHDFSPKPVSPCHGAPIVLHPTDQSHHSAKPSVLPAVIISKPSQEETSFHTSHGRKIAATDFFFFLGLPNARHLSHFNDWSFNFTEIYGAVCVGRSSISLVVYSSFKILILEGSSKIYFTAVCVTIYEHNYVNITITDLPFDREV